MKSHICGKPTDKMSQSDREELITVIKRFTKETVEKCNVEAKLQENGEDK